MAKLLRCTDRYAHVELHVPRELWDEMQDRHFSTGEALGAVRTASLNGIRARLVALAMQELEHRYGADGAESPATAGDSELPPHLQRVPVRE